MKVMMIHQNGAPHGGGGQIAMHRLHRVLQDAGVESFIACRRPGGDHKDVIELPHSERIESLLGMISWRLGLNDVHCVSSFKIKNFKPFRDADVINIHGLHTNFFNYLALPGMAKVKPIVFTLHDMWALTGHCSQSHGCERWKSGCGKCPHLDVYPPLTRDGTAIEWRLKNWAYKRSRMTIVSPSRWLAKMARESMLNRFPIHYIPNGVDTGLFKPLDRTMCRETLGIPRDHFVIMFAAASLNNPGKGGDLLSEALRDLPEPIKQKCTLLLLGDCNDEDMQIASGLHAVSLGFVREDDKKAVAYSAADIFVLPSRAENHSLVLLESGACGTPSVAFDVGGNSEIVRHLQTGYLAPTVCADALRDGIMYMFDHDDQRQRLGRGIRRLVCDEFSLDQHVDRYLRLFEYVLTQNVEPQVAPAPSFYI